MKQVSKRPVISIVIPLYNKESEVARSMKSVLSQSFTDFEVVVVNDGSTDEGPNIVKAINDLRLRLIDQPNAGVSSARNRGIAEAQADLIVFLDADDQWETDFLETIIRLRDKFPSCDVFATNYCFRGANDYKRPTIIRGLPGEFKEGILTDYFKIAAQSDPPLWTSAVVMKKIAIQDMGGFPIGVSTGEDLLTWARLASKYTIAYSLKPCVIFQLRAYSPDCHIRVPDVPDIVGKELSCLLENIGLKKSKSLKRYIALWHKMRASIFLQCGRNNDSLREIQRAAFLAGLNYKLVIMLILTLMPKNCSMTVSRYLYNLRKV